MGLDKLEGVLLNDYLAIEQEDRVRYEYHLGQLIRMAGGTIAHSDICNNVAAELHNHAKRTGKCKGFNSEIKIEVKAGERYVYPDAGMSCPDHKKSKLITGAITNPRVVVEVLSDDSGPYDLGKKLRWYFAISTVMEYLLVYQDRPEVMLYRRHSSGDLFGLHAAEGMKSSIELTSIGLTLPLADIYYGVDLGQQVK